MSKYKTSKNLFQYIILFFFITFLLPGCDTKSLATTDKVIKIANKAARKAGHHLDEYEEPEVSTTDLMDGTVHYTWSVFYKGKPVKFSNGGFGLIIGNDFIVNVDETISKTKVWEGY